MRIHAHTWTTGRVPHGDATWTWDKFKRVFGIDAALNRMAFNLDVFLTIAQFFAKRHANLLLHNIHPRHHFGNRMLDLHPRIHLNKEELAVFIQKFKRARTAITNAFAGIDAACANFINQFAWNTGGRCFLDDFLMTTLQ